MTPGPTSAGFNLESPDVTTNRLRTNEQSTTGDHQPSQIQFTPTNNYFRNVSENKDVVKLISLLATCINYIGFLILIDKDFLCCFRI
jgi:hypothetical protein